MTEDTTKWPFGGEKVMNNITQEKLFPEKIVEQQEVTPVTLQSNEVKHEIKQSTIKTKFKNINIDTILNIALIILITLLAITFLYLVQVGKFKAEISNNMTYTSPAITAPTTNNNDFSFTPNTTNVYNNNFTLPNINCNCNCV